MSETNLVQVHNLHRRFGDHHAVKGVSFHLERGEVLGFLGPNGAGKTTTLQMLCGALAPTEGRIEIDGIDLLDQPKRAKARLGYLPEQPPLYHELTVDEFLGFCARLHRIPRENRARAIGRAKERCSLESVGRRLIGNLSKGFQQRVGIAQAIMHMPAVVMLDEPTTGLDPNQIREIRALIRELRDAHGIVLCTHILPEVQSVCDRVQILNEGVLVMTSSLDAVNAADGVERLRVGLRRRPAQGVMESIEDVTQVSYLDDNLAIIEHRPGARVAERISERAVADGWGLFELAAHNNTLEEVFVRLTCADDSASSDSTT